MSSGGGDVAVVAGGAGALGSAVVRRLAANGWRVVALGRGDSIDRVPPVAEAVVCDLSDPVAVAALTDRMADAGRWRATVICSGGYAGGTAVELEDAAILEQLELNLLGPWRLLRLSARAMAGAGTPGRMVVTVGRAALEVGVGQAAYQVAKVGAARLVEVMGRELGGSGTTVNAVLPSIMDTPANRAAMPGADTTAWVPVEAVVDAVEWLLGDSSGHVSGALIPVYGGA